MDKQRIPKHYRNVYTDIVDNYMLVYSPLSEKGLALLNQEAVFFYNLIDNERTLEKIVTEAQQVDPQVTLETVTSIYQQFVESEIIYFDKPKTPAFINAKMPSHLGVWFHITNQCNLRCTYCYIHKTPDKMSEETAFKAIDKIISSSKKHGIKTITLKFAGGEPLLEFKKVMAVVERGNQLVADTDIQIQYTIISNGVLITDKVCEILKKNHMRLAISIDGLEKYHDQTRVFTNGLGSFNLVMKGIEKVLQHNIQFNASITVTNKNVDNIPTLTAFLLEKKIPFAFNLFRENPFVEEKLENDDKKLVAKLKEAYALIKKSPPPYSLLNGILDRVTFKKPHLYTCGVGYNYLVIRHDGALVSCQMTQNSPIGSIEDEDLIETMLRGSFVRPRGLTVLGKTPCKDCRWKFICCGGCPLTTKEQKGTYETSTPYCSVYKELIPEALQIEAARLIKYGFKKTTQDVESSYEVI
jgi:uncharacterized protein